jgi:hypothetical protein
MGGPGAGAAQAKGEKLPPSGPHGGLLVRFGQSSAELILADTSVSMYWYADGAAASTPSTLKPRLTLESPGRRQRTVRLDPKEDRFEAAVDWEGERVLRLLVEVSIERRRRRASVVWRLDQDRSRLIDLPF